MNVHIKICQKLRDGSEATFEQAQDTKRIYIQRQGKKLEFVGKVGQTIEVTNISDVVRGKLHEINFDEEALHIMKTEHDIKCILFGEIISMRGISIDEDLPIIDLVLGRDVSPNERELNNVDGSVSLWAIKLVSNETNEGIFLYHNNAPCTYYKITEDLNMWNYREVLMDEIDGAMFDHKLKR